MFTGLVLKRGRGLPALQPVLVGIKLEELDEEDLKAAGKLPRNSRGINLSDGDCDSFHIYWLQKAKRFVWARH
jgi:hypothetical protein